MTAKCSSSLLQICISFLLTSSISALKEVVEEVFFPDALPQIGGSDKDCWTHDALRGICVHYSQCSDAQNRPNNEDICRWEGDKNPIICCPKENNTSSNKSDEDKKKNIQGTNVCGMVEFPASSKKNTNTPFFSRQFVEGEFTERGVWPWMAVIGRREGSGIKWFCGGVLINTRYILTAAHCTVTKSTRLEVVRLGEHNLLSRQDDDTVEDFGVDTVIRHPGYMYPVVYHDVALLHLDRRVDYSSAIRPVCLPLSTNDFSGRRAAAVGWGLIRTYDSPSVMPKAVELTVYNHSYCSSLYKNRPELTKVSPNGFVESQLCAGHWDYQRNTCQSDPGGPLMVLNDKDGLIYVVGVTTGGISCGQSGQPGIYARVTSYIHWIIENASS